jgi:Cof subfamily protein (haloacid dehalogenase superfamily)
MKILERGSNIIAKPKLLVLDIDGTLINSANSISGVDQAALKLASQAGVKIALCTGRVFETAQKILQQLALSGFHIFFDGALVCNHLGLEEIYSRPIPPQTAKRASELALSMNIMLDFYSLQRFYVMRKSWRSNIRKDYFGIEAYEADFRTLWQHERLLKGTLIYSSIDDEKTTRSFLALLQDILSFSWSTIPAYPGYHFVNMIDKGVSKGQAVEALAAHYQISLNEVMAVGDGSNDIPLLAAAGIAVAMENAPDTLKLEADFVTADVEHHGVSQAIRQFIL